MPPQRLQGISAYLGVNDWLNFWLKFLMLGGIYLVAIAYYRHRQEAHPRKYLLSGCS
jgi:Flp pilus assembly protein protease CpaA